jgi:hypothetical protein
VKQDQVIGRQDFVQIAMEIRHRGEEHASGWLKALGNEQMAATLRETVLEDDTSTTSWVNWMAEELKPADEMGEQLACSGNGGERRGRWESGSEARPGRWEE